MNRIMESLKTTRLYNWINLFAYIAMVTINVLANTLPLGGNTSGQVSDRYASLFTPAGITFSIWGVIYIFLGIVLIRQLLSRRDEHKMTTNKIGGLFAISCALNIVWIFSWHYGLITMATIIIFALLISLIVLMVMVKDDLLMSLAFGIYTAWIMVASIASIFVQVAAGGTNLITAGGEAFAIIAIVLSGAILTVITILSENWTFSAVGVWAFIGIIIRQVSQYNDKYTLVTWSSIIMIAVMVAGIALIAYQFIKKNKKPADEITSEKSLEVMTG